MTPQIEPSAGELTEAKAGQLKAGGFVPQRQRGKITVRCKVPGGRITAQRLETIAKVAREHGSGLVHLSVRQSAEILDVDLAKLEVVARELAEGGQEIASCGRRFRVTTACGGCEYNPNGWTDTQRLALEATDRFFGRETPHKFKVCFSGCVRDCVRARHADLGFQGMVKPELLAENCTHCTLCVRACQDDALRMDESGIPVWDPARCIGCGDCVKACAFEAMAASRVGHGVFVGGKHGKHPHAAYPIAQLVPDEQVPAVIEVTMGWYREQGVSGERLGDVLDRAGVDSYRRALRGVVGEALLTPADAEQPRWRRIFCRGLAETFPVYGDLQEGAR
ncbi:MAG: 4Fe-4S dicluster domain-containing protein [Armatimonadota bacterium]